MRPSAAGPIHWPHRLVHQREDERVGLLVADRLVGVYRPIHAGAGPVEGRPTGPVAASGERGGGRGEAVRRRAPVPAGRAPTSAPSDVRSTVGTVEYVLSVAQVRHARR
jgi:hypothetical protein